jgi:hypothetical protein
MNDKEKYLLPWEKDTVYCLRRFYTERNKSFYLECRLKKDMFY